MNAELVVAAFDGIPYTTYVVVILKFAHSSLMFLFLAAIATGTTNGVGSTVSKPSATASSLKPNSIHLHAFIATFAAI